jgi:hypothetical protein
VLLGHEWPNELFRNTSVSTVKTIRIPMIAEMRTIGGMPDDFGTPRSSLTSYKLLPSSENAERRENDQNASECHQAEQ